MKLSDLMMRDEQRRKARNCNECSNEQFNRCSNELNHMLCTKFELSAIAHTVVETYPDIIYHLEATLQIYHGTPAHQQALLKLQELKVLLAEAEKVEQN